MTSFLKGTKTNYRYKNKYVILWNDNNVFSNYITSSAQLITYFHIEVLYICK